MEFLSVMRTRVKEALRISHAESDTEIGDLINAAIADLELMGIDSAHMNTQEPLIVRAIIVYCKAGYGLDNGDAEKYAAAYEALKLKMALSGRYTE